MGSDSAAGRGAWLRSREPGAASAEAESSPARRLSVALRLPRASPPPAAPHGASADGFALSAGPGPSLNPPWKCYKRRPASQGW